jgi:hypothetical protein
MRCHILGCHSRWRICNLPNKSSFLLHVYHVALLNPQAHHLCFLIQMWANSEMATWHSHHLLNRYPTYISLYIGVSLTHGYLHDQPLLTTWYQLLNDKLVISLIPLNSIILLKGICGAINTSPPCCKDWPQILKCPSNLDYKYVTSIPSPSSIVRLRHIIDDVIDVHSSTVTQ